MQPALDPGGGFAHDSGFFARIACTPFRINSEISTLRVSGIEERRELIQGVPDSVSPSKTGERVVARYIFSFLPTAVRKFRLYFI